MDPTVRRRLIAEAAARVFADHDPSEVSFEAVAEEAGVSRSLVYSYFGDRGSLLAAAYASETERLDAELGIGDLVGTDRERVEQGIRAYLEFAFANRPSWNLIASAASSRHPAVRAALATRTERIGALLGDSAEAAMLVRGVIGMLDASVIHLLDHDESDVAELAEVLTQVVWAGVSSLAEPA
jgi:AcrR family transcriptional regulator